jgi:hypothetical protein
MPRSAVLASPPVLEVGERSLRERWRERRRLAEQDRRAAQQAERLLLGVLLADASDLVHAGWVQHCWFTVEDEDGQRRRIGARNLRDLNRQPVREVCLVGAIVQAAGGVDRAGSQPVHRAIDVTWATLYDERAPWTPSPAVRLAYIHDLIRWNDTPRRSADEVADLLTAASCRARE